MPANPPTNLPAFRIPAIVTPQSDGSWLVKPGKPVLDDEEERTPKQAAAYLKLGLSTVYDLVEIGKLASRRPSPFKILIPLSALREYKAASRDPEFHQPRRK
jgi:excisionase family DNA binding protein